MYIDLTLCPYFLYDCITSVEGKRVYFTCIGNIDKNYSYI